MFVLSKIAKKTIILVCRSQDRSIRRLLGPRQRSMPVQIETQLMRVLPKHRRKRVKSATFSNSQTNSNEF